MLEPETLKLVSSNWHLGQVPRLSPFAVQSHVPAPLLLCLLPPPDSPHLTTAAVVHGPGLRLTGLLSPQSPNQRSSSVARCPHAQPGSPLVLRDERDCQSEGGNIAREQREARPSLTTTLSPKFQSRGQHALKKHAWRSSTAFPCPLLTAQRLVDSLSPRPARRSPPGFLALALQTAPVLPAHFPPDTTHAPHTTHNPPPTRDATRPIHHHTPWS